MYEELMRKWICDYAKHVDETEITFFDQVIAKKDRALLSKVVSEMVCVHIASLAKIQVSFMEKELDGDYIKLVAKNLKNTIKDAREEYNVLDMHNSP